MSDSGRFQRKNERGRMRSALSRYEESDDFELPEEEEVYIPKREKPIKRDSSPKWSRGPDKRLVD